MSQKASESEIVSYNCNKCEKVYKSTQSLIAHTRIKHHKAITAKEIIDRFNIGKQKENNQSKEDDLNALDSVTDDELKQALDDAEFDHLISESNDLLSEAESINADKQCQECASKYESASNCYACRIIIIFRPRYKSVRQL